MPTVLILSSLVAAEPIGGSAQAVEFARRGLDPILVPTVLVGRSPAKGAVGQPVDAAHFARMIDDVAAEGVLDRADLVITGHFSSAAQVEAAARALARVPVAVIVVDPIMGDHPNGLYVKPEVAEAVAALLVPAAHYLTPNAWELERLAPGPVAEAPRRLGRPILATSLPAGEGDIALAWLEADHAILFVHRRLPAAPNGLGDYVTAVFGAGLLQGLEPRAAAEAAARAAAARLGVGEVRLETRR